jgi:hypothetical protein
LGRWRDAWAVLRGRQTVLDPEEAARQLAESDERYIRRDEVAELNTRLQEIDFAMTEWWDKLNTMLARLRKRDQRGSVEAGAPTADPPPIHDRAAAKAALRRTYTAQRKA